MPLEQRVNPKELKPLKIASHQNAIKRLGQFPVISISFKEVKGGSYEEIAEGVKAQIINLFVQHRHLKQYTEDGSDALEESQKEKFSRYFKGNISKEDLNNSLKDLSELLFKHFRQKVYILIDEYDTPINSAYLEFGYNINEFNKVLKIFRSIFGSSLKSNDYLERSLIAGILWIAKANLFSDLNNPTENTLGDEGFSKFYGLT